MMTLEEAIAHCEDVAEEKENESKLLCQSEGASIGCLTCAEEHRQLAEWLKELKTYREQAPKEEPERVMCATCKHYNEHPAGMLAVERWCRSPIWEKAGRAPHHIDHDGFKLIMCNYWEPKEEGKHDGNI